jgi:hypothetical protein
MPSRQTIYVISAFVIAALLAASYIESRADRARLAATIAAQNQIIAAANARELATSSALKTTLDQIAAIKQNAQTPAQIIAALPQSIPLPEPIRLANSANPSARQGTPSTESQTPPAPSNSHSNPPTNPATGAPVALAPSQPRGQSAAAPSMPTRLSHLKSEIFHFAPRLATNSSPTPAANSNPQSEVTRTEVSQAEVTSGEVTQAESVHGEAPPSEISRTAEQGTPSPNFHADSNSDSISHPSAIPGANSNASPNSNPFAAPPSSAPSSATPASQDAILPAADLKPLFDYIQDCRACQAQLAAAQSILRDEQTRSAALARERDAALTAAKGGTLWRRLARNARWLAIGAAAGALLSHHAL